MRFKSDRLLYYLDSLDLIDNRIEPGTTRTREEWAKIERLCRALRAAREEIEMHLRAVERLVR